MRRTGSGRRPPTATPAPCTRTGRSQIDELIAAARVPVFLLDEHQVVKPGEIGTVEAIKSHGVVVGVPRPPRSAQRPVPVRRQQEVRAMGAAAARPGSRRPRGVGWRRPLRGHAGRFPGGDGEHPAAASMTEGYSARMSAGYCWPWSDPDRTARWSSDVRIGDWARPWNVKGDRAVGDGPPSALWATMDGRLRPGRLRLHRPGLRVRLVRRHHRPGPGRPPRPDDHRQGRQ